VIRVRLREVIRRREKATGDRITYDWLAKRTGLSRATIEAIGSRPTYNSGNRLTAPARGIHIKRLYCSLQRV